MPDPDLALSVRHVRYGYGDLTVVWDVSFDAYVGETVAIVGRNGAGKSTLMFGLAGIVPGGGGTVELLGLNVTRASPWTRARRGICLVPEGKRIFRALTVEENLAVAFPNGTRARDRRRQIAQILDRFPMLAEKRSHVSGTLSGGQQQLLAIASALTANPRVLLVDEPSSGLAPRAVDQVLDTLAELKREGIAVVLVEQLVEEVVTGVADRVVVIEQGRVVTDDIPENISLADLERRIYAA